MPAELLPEALDAAGPALDSTITFASSAAPAVLTAAIGWWPGVGQEKQAQISRHKLIAERKYLTVQAAVHRAAESPTHFEVHAQNLITVLRRELGSARVYCDDLPFRALDDALTGTEATDNESPTREAKAVTPAPITVTLEKARVLRPGAFGSDIGDGYVVKNAVTDVFEARRFRIWQAIGRIESYWNDKASRVLEMEAIQRSFAIKVPPKPVDPNTPHRLWDRLFAFPNGRNRLTLGL